CAATRGCSPRGRLGGLQRGGPPQFGANHCWIAPQPIASCLLTFPATASRPSTALTCKVRIFAASSRALSSRAASSTVDLDWPPEFAVDGPAADPGVECSKASATDEPVVARSS